MHFFCFAIISLLKEHGPSLAKKLNPLYHRMLCLIEIVKWFWSRFSYVINVFWVVPHYFSSNFEKGRGLTLILNEHEYPLPMPLFCAKFG